MATLGRKRGAQTQPINLAEIIFRRQLGETSRIRKIPPSLQIPIESILDEDRALLSCIILGFTSDSQHLLSYTTTPSPACDHERGHHLQVWSFEPGTPCQRLYNIQLFAHADQEDGLAAGLRAAGDSLAGIEEQSLKITAFEAPVGGGLLVVHGIAAHQPDELATHHFTLVPGLSQRPARILAAHHTRALPDRERLGSRHFSEAHQAQCTANNFDPGVQFLPPATLLLASCHLLCCVRLTAAVLPAAAWQAASLASSPAGSPLDGPASSPAAAAPQAAPRASSGAARPPLAAAARGGAAAARQPASEQAGLPGRQQQRRAPASGGAAGQAQPGSDAWELPDGPSPADPAGQPRGGPAEPAGACSDPYELPDSPDSSSPAPAPSPASPPRVGAPAAARSEAGPAAECRREGWEAPGAPHALPEPLSEARCHPAVELLDARGRSCCLAGAVTDVRRAQGSAGLVGLAAAHGHPAGAAVDVGALVDRGFTCFFGGQPPCRGWDTSTYEVELLQTLPPEPGDGGGLGSALLLLSCFIFPTLASAHMPPGDVPAAQRPLAERLVLMAVQCDLLTCASRFLWLEEYRGPLETPHLLRGLVGSGAAAAAAQGWRPPWARLAHLADSPHRWAAHIRRWDGMNGRAGPRAHALTNTNVVSGRCSLRHILHPSLPLCLLGFGAQP